MSSNRGRPEGAKGKPLERQHFTLAALAVQLGRSIAGTVTDERLTLAQVAKWIGLKDRASYHWTKGKVCPLDPAAGAQPFVPPTSFDDAREKLVAHAKAFLEGYEVENKRWLEERKKQLKAARELVKLFGEEGAQTPG